MNGILTGRIGVWLG